MSKLFEYDEAGVREILGDAVQENGSLFDGGKYLSWSPGDSTATLDGWDFTAEELMAIAWWMVNK